MKYTIEFEKVLNQWVVFKVDKNAKFEVFRNKTKKCCKEFIKTMEVKNERKKHLSKNVRSNTKNKQGK